MKISAIIIIIVALIVCMAIGFLIGKAIYRDKAISENPIQQLRLGNNKFELTNPLLACDTESNKEYRELDPLKAKLQKLISEQKNSGQAERVSVYYRALNTGHWTGIDEDDKYVPASLVKVPLLIAYMKKAESNPETLQKKYIYNSDDVDEKQSLQKPPTPFIFGKEYTAQELLYRMIAYSGNNSHLVLAQNMDQDFLRDVYSDLGFSHTDFMSTRALENSISPKTFSTFFRILYNASYLNRDYSQKALELLAASTFKDGLVAGVPGYLKVAHKFGERTVINGSTDNVLFRELHDCGIIYNGDNPYLLCVMTQGNNFDNLKDVIKNVSRLVFETTSLF